MAPDSADQWLGLALRWIAVAAMALAGLLFMTSMPGRSYTGPFRPLSPEEQAICDRLEAHVRTLGGDIGERNILHHEALDSAAGYIEDTLQSYGYDVTIQAFRVRGVAVRNIACERTGLSRPDELLVVGAHYDSVIGSPGANDNGSGVAALLELARRMTDTEPDRSVRFVAFVNEEPPFFQTDTMGSRVYAGRCRRQDENIVGMISLETIGYYSGKEGSQQYPFPFSLFYPDRGEFIGFVGNVFSRRLVRQCVESFREHTLFASEGVAAPGWISGIGWSDHWSFWQEGYPALMVTDTAPFRYHHYHGATDTPDRLCYPQMSRVVGGLGRMITDLTGAK